jgi:hypothetical protein
MPKRFVEIVVRKNELPAIYSAYDMLEVLQRINDFLAEGTPVNPSALYDDKETMAQAVARIVKHAGGA